VTEQSDTPAAEPDPSPQGETGDGTQLTLDEAPETTPEVPPAEPTPAEPVPEVPPAEPTPEVPPAEPTPAEPVPEVPPAEPTPEVPPADPIPEVPAADPPSTPIVPAPPATPVTPGAAPVPPPSQTAVAAAPPQPVSDPAEWGRVDEEGTVWVRTVEGERSVGSYPGAEAPEALAYFGRKFDELAGQVALLEQRVASGGVSLADAQTSVDHLHEQVVDANAVGDLAALVGRLGVLSEAIAQRKVRRDAERAKARERAAVTKEKIVSEAESLSTSTDWKKAGDRMRALLDEWKAAPRLERKADDALWKRFSHARTAFDKRRRVHFAELDEQRAGAAQRKEKLIKEAEALSSSKEWGDTAKRYRELMDQWKAAGRARRDVEDEPRAVPPLDLHRLGDPLAHGRAAPLAGPRAERGTEDVGVGVPAVADVRQ